MDEEEGAFGCVPACELVGWLVSQSVTGIGIDGSQQERVWC